MTGTAGDFPGGDRWTGPGQTLKGDDRGPGPPRAHGQRPLQTSSAVSGVVRAGRVPRGQDTPSRFSAPDPSRTTGTGSPTWFSAVNQGSHDPPSSQACPPRFIHPENAPNLCPKHSPKLPGPTSQAPRLGAAPHFPEKLFCRTGQPVCSVQSKDPGVSPACPLAYSGFRLGAQLGRT